VATIQRLSDRVVRTIAAGEVIDSLAAAVRELAENALDAGASRLAVDISPDRGYVRLADNGCGMDKANLRLAALPHTTSKIGDCEDLTRIGSLGFRGEALHGLARLSRLQVASRPRDGVGWRVRYADTGEPLSLETAAIAPGTIVTIGDLFANWPARKEGLPPAARQMKAVQETIVHLSLCHPAIAWQVCRDDRRWFSISPGRNAIDILSQVMRSIRPSDLQYLQWELDVGVNGVDPSFPNTERANAIRPYIELTVGLPDRCHRRRLDGVKIAVNGRVVRVPDLERTVVAAFSRTLPRDRYPVAFLHLHVDPADVDWNRNPDKSEIYLHRLDAWQTAILEAVDRALTASPADIETANPTRVKKLLKVAEKTGRYDLSDPLPTPEKRSGLPKLKAVAQVNQTYIVAEHPAGLWLIEQHIAHERVLYEELCDRWQLVALNPPIVLENLTTKQVEQLQRLDLEIEPFGEQLWSVRNAPALLRDRDDCAEALLELSQGDLEAAKVATACRSAIRNGTVLSLEEMQNLVDRWQKTRHPRTCPHGRPIYLSLEETSLARFFRRHWVIGKSHGI